MRSIIFGLLALAIGLFSGGCKVDVDDDATVVRPPEVEVKVPD